MPAWLYALIVFVPAALAAHFFSMPEFTVFVLSAVGLIPLAGLIGKATEELAHHVGPRYGGLLNATFGNAAELIITLFAIRQGLLTLVKASITGSIIGNTLFILGTSLLVSGLRYQRQDFNARDASLNAAMMILAIAGLYLPAVFTTSVRDASLIEELSLLVAGVLLATYVAYLIYTLFHTPAKEQPSGVQERGAGLSSDGGEERPSWGIRRSLLVLGGATVGAAVSSELLVSTVEPVTRELGLSEFFVGVVIVALVGNAAEHFSAIQMAWHKRLDVSLSIAASSSTQIALFVAPLLVFASLLLGHPMDLIFVPLELAILGLATAIFAYISVDGESNWLEGVQLIGIYVIAAFAFFLIPVSHP